MLKRRKASVLKLVPNLNDTAGSPRIDLLTGADVGDVVTLRWPEINISAIRRNVVAFAGWGRVVPTGNETGLVPVFFRPVKGQCIH